MSLTQEFMEPGQEEFVACLVSVRYAKVTLVRITVANEFLEVLEQSRVLKVGEAIKPIGGVRIEVTKEYRMAIQKDRAEFLDILTSLAMEAVKIQRELGQMPWAASWPAREDEIFVERDAGPAGETKYSWKPRYWRKEKQRWKEMPSQHVSPLET